MKRARGTARAFGTARCAAESSPNAHFCLGSGKPSAKKQMKQLKRLRRIQTAVDTAAQGNTILIRTFVPSVPPPGKTLPGRQIQTTMWRVSMDDAISLAEVGAGARRAGGEMQHQNSARWLTH